MQWLHGYVSLLDPVFSSSHLVKQRKANPSITILKPAAHPFPIINLPLPDSDSEVILDATVLAEIWKDIRRTTLPSWLGSPPKKLGSKAQGKLSADGWRTFCTINLVITLVRLWGRLDGRTRPKKLLENFINLIIAATWATKRTMSEERVQIVEQHLQLYLTSLVSLFSSSVLTVNHHLCLHLAECLRLFGPVHGWWAFPFERFNGIIQQIKTNFKFGEFIIDPRRIPV
jgi:Domain of unknown function (DUF4218)